MIPTPSDEEIEVWNGIIAAMDDGHSFLSLEVQKMLRCFFLNMKHLARRVEGEFPDNCLDDQEKAAIQLADSITLEET